MRKLAKFIIAVVFLAMLVTIIALALPPVAEALYVIFVLTLGKTLVTVITNTLTQLMAWGATGFLPAFVILISTAVVAWIGGILFRKYVWSPSGSSLTKTKQAVADKMAEYQKQLSTPDLYVPAATQAATPQEIIVEETSETE